MTHFAGRYIPFTKTLPRQDLLSRLLRIFGINRTYEFHGLDLVEPGDQRYEAAPYGIVMFESTPMNFIP